MNTSTVLRLGLFAFGAVAACAWAPAAVADDGTQTTLGGQADVGGGQMWTVTGLQPSSDSIPFQAAGTLWEATATAAPVGGGIPVVPGFAARGGADNYPVLWPVPTANGVNPAALPAGGSTTGKLYFDVVGQAPSSVVYSSNGHDAAVWVQPPPAAGAPSSTNYSPAPYSSSAPMTGGMPAPTPKAPAAPAPAAGSSGTPLPAASGSSGTPLPAENSATTPAPTSGSSGTPATAGSSGTPASGSSGTPATGTQPSAAAASPAATPAPAAASPSAAAPTTAAAPAPTTPAAPSGSAGTPLTAPTTTVVPAG